MRPKRSAARDNLAYFGVTPPRGVSLTKLKALYDAWPVEVRVLFGAWKAPHLEGLLRCRDGSGPADGGEGRSGAARDACRRHGAGEVRWHRDLRLLEDVAQRHATLDLGRGVGRARPAHEADLV